MEHPFYSLPQEIVDSLEEDHVVRRFLEDKAMPLPLTDPKHPAVSRIVEELT